MRIQTFLSIPIAITLSLLHGIAWGGPILSYETTVRAILSYESTAKTIMRTMEGATTAVRKESYEYIKLDNCTLDYRVDGTYPSGIPYSIRFSQLDFSQFDRNESRAGNDYAAYVMLNFKKEVKYNNGVQLLPIHTVMVIVSDYDRARTLFDLFLRLGELCGTKTSSS